MKPKNEDVIYKVTYCQFSKPINLGGNYQKTVDKIPLNYEIDKPGSRATLELALWEGEYIKVFSKNGLISIVPIQNVAVMDLAELTAEQKKQYKDLVG